MLDRSYDRRTRILIRAVLIAIAIPVVVARAQTGIVVGTVTDRASAQPIEAARIQIGAGLAVATDPRGHFVLRNTPTGSQIVRVTRIGFRPESRTITIAERDSTRADFALSQSVVELSEVVVTGTGGAVEKKKLGASMAVVDVSQLQDQMAITDIGQALSAKVPGLRSLSVGGGAGAAKDLRIRGFASFSLNQRPVVYIDGVRIDTRASEWTGATGIKGMACCSFAGGTSTDRMNDLNPDDVERVEVLKGAAAATLYGSEASNGVIQIFTKRGRGESRPTWNFAVTGGFDKNRMNLPTKLFPNFQGPADSTGFRQRARDANDLIEAGPYQGYELSVQGGGMRSNYYASGGWADQQGSIQPNWAKRGNLRLNLTFLPTDKWTVEARSAYTRNHVAELQAGNNWTALLGNALNGDPRKATRARPYGEAWVPVADIKRMDTYSNADRWTGGVTASYAMFQNFTHKFTAGVDQVAEEKGRFFPFAGDYGSAGVTLGQRNLGYRDFTSYTVEYLGQLNFAMPFSGITSDLSFGAQGLREVERLNMAVGNTFAGPGVSTVTAASTTTGAEGFSERTNIGFHLQNRFSFGEKLFATVGMRVDGNSAFGENYGFKRFPKADVSWIASQYGFLPKWVSSLKLRSAIGQAGKAPGAFDKFTTFSARSVFTGTPGVVPENPGNVELRPETSTELEGGFESGFFNDRLGIESSIYWQFTKDAIVGVPNPPSLGFGASRKVNIGRLDNHGWETSINYLAVSTARLDWSTSLRFDGNHNKVISVGGVQLAGNAVREGYPVQGVWSRPATGYSVVNGKPVTTRGDTAVYFGPPFATLNSSVGNTFRFGPFQAYALVTVSRGASFNNGDRPYRVRQGGGDELLQFLNPDGTATFKSDSVAQYWSIMDAVETRNATRLRELSLTYSVPERFSSRYGLGRTLLTLTGQNLMWWDRCHCFDPDMNYAGGDAFTVTSGFLAQPSPRMFRVAVRTRF